MMFSFLILAHGAVSRHAGQNRMTIVPDVPFAQQLLKKRSGWSITDMV